ncbi:MAG: hypothetical protein IT473_14420 [Lysobacter sp.]|nr:hypothetical protein [Lysobacter sp.]
MTTHAEAIGASQDATHDERPLALLALLAEEDGVSVPRAAKRLGLAASELRRLLVALGDDAQLGGLGLVECRASDRGHDRLWLTERGRALCLGASAVDPGAANLDATDA